MYNLTTEKKAIWRQETVVCDYNIYVGDMTDGIDGHIEALDLIRAAGEDDTITIMITSVGGEVDIAENYIAAMRESKASITARAVGGVASAGTMIWLSAPNRACDERAFFMFHNVQCGGDGDAYNLKIRIDFYDRFFKEMYEPMYREIMTDAELATVFSGGEVYISGREMIKRLSKDAERAKEKDSPQEALQLGEPYPLAMINSPAPFDFTITLDSGFSKKFDLGNLSFDDFSEYSWAEIREIAEATGTDLPGGSFRTDVLKIIDVLKTGDID